MAKNTRYDFEIALAGNPNVGKSTIFNALTGMKQHTGNWPGKTVELAIGYAEGKKYTYKLSDLPGTYSLASHSPEEEIAREHITSGKCDAVIVVCDATCLERNLNLALQIIKTGVKTLLCVNLLDEAKRKNIEVDIDLLSEKLGVPVIGTVGRSKKSAKHILDALDELITSPNSVAGQTEEIHEDEDIKEIILHAEDICKDVVRIDKKKYRSRDKRLDRILTGRIVGYPIMILLLAAVFWITLKGANYPSELLSRGLFYIEGKLDTLFRFIGVPEKITDALVHGVYRVLAWVVSVMLPPMAIFFPFFTLLEDSGYLPRIAYNLDKPFKCAGACGKQALTMCMGFGCNAVGVVGCRIIDSPRERLLAIVTNSFVPCNGRFPTMIALISMFFVSGGFLSSVKSTLLLTLSVLLGILATFASTKLLSLTVLKGEPSSFTLELPPYRRPQIGKTIIRSVFDRTLFVLGRSVAFAAPAGLVIWLLANITVGGASLLSLAASFLDPLGKIMGLDGVILLAFVLALPANEIVIPIIIMSYLSSGTLTDISDLSALREFFIMNGWTLKTALSMLIFTLFHWPCATTLMTVKKETGKLSYTFLSALLPTLFGALLCMLINLVL